MDLITISAQINDMNKRKESLQKEYERNIKKCNTALECLSREKNLLLNGLDLEKIKLAETLITVEGEVGEGSASRQKCIDDMIYFLTELNHRTYHSPREAYYGVKNYSGFGDQREDHPFGYGPRHGHIVFHVQLNEDVRNREIFKNEREACLYYLMNIKKIQQGEKNAYTT